MMYIIMSDTNAGASLGTPMPICDYNGKYRKPTLLSERYGIRELVCTNPEGKSPRPAGTAS